MSEIVEYKGFTIKLIEEDGDWVAEISRRGDREGYMSSFGVNRDSALNRAKEAIDKIIGAINRKAYYMGGGGVNEPTPGKPKYKADPAITVQPRFVEPLYRNYDLYDVEGILGPAKHGPGSGWNHMNEFKSIKEFLDFRRQKLKGKYVAEDTWIEDTAANRKGRVDKMKIRASLLSKIIKTASGGDDNDGPNFDYGDGAYTAMSEGKKMKTITDAPHKGPGAFFADDNADHMLPPKEHGTSIYDWKNSPYQGKPKAPKRRDSNNIDFPIDDQVTPIVGDHGSYVDSAPISYQENYTAEPDQDGKSEEALDFGEDLTNEDAPIGRFAPDSDIDLDKLEQKYLTPAETEIYGLPDGVDPEAKDADQTISTENPDYGITDSGRQMYEDKWNV